MASRKKRDPVANAGGNALQDPGTASGAESQTVIVGLVEGSPEPKPMEGPETPSKKPAPRKPRTRKRTPAEPVPVADVLVATPAPILEPPPLPPAPPWADASEALRQVLGQCQQVQDQLRTLRQDLQQTAKEAAEVKESSLTVKQGLAEAGDVLGQLHQVRTLREELRDAVKDATDARERSEAIRQHLVEAGDAIGQFHQARMVREELQDTLREAGQVSQQAQVIKQELLATEGALDGLRQSLDRIKTLREELESAVAGVDEVKERSQAVKQGLLDTEGSVAAIRQSLDTLREDLKSQFREASERVVALGESCRDLQRDMGGIKDQVATLQPAQPASPSSVVVSVADAQSNTPIASVTHGPGAGIMMELPPPSLDPPSNGVAHLEGKTWLGITVNAEAMVIDVVPDSPAEKAGVLRDDVIVEADGKAIHNCEDLRLAMEQADPDRDVKLTVKRGEQQQELTAHLSEAAVS